MSQSNNPSLSRYLLLLMRQLTAQENATLSKSFKNIQVYHPDLNANNNDLGKISFDLLVVDITKQQGHQFVEMIAPQCKNFGINIVVLKNTYCNAKAYTDSLGDVSVIKQVADLDPLNLAIYFKKTKLPKLENRILNFLKKLLKFFLKQQSS